MNPDAWLTIALVCGSGAMSPGPSLAVVLKNTVEGGRGKGVACALGHGLGVGIYAFIAVAGLTALVAAIERPVMIAGALYLLWMGGKILRATWGSADDTTDPEPDAHASSEESSDASRGGFQEGFAIAFLNPKIAVFFLALLSNLVPSEATLVERSGVASLAMAIDALWYVIVAAALAGTGAVAWLRRNGRSVDRVFGLVLVGLGAWVLWRSVG
ncbi:MAG: LysE family translocator [Planctomycetota bacterium]